jgi:NhaP-type Na+/H+ or K+/H+ antiporter
VRLDVSAAMFFTATGLLAGPAFGVLDLHVGSEQVRLLADVTLTLVLFGDASRLSLGALRSGEYVVPLRLLGIGLPLTIAAGALAGAALLPSVGLPEALVLAVMLACTDAALGQAVVTDDRLPSRIRQGLNVESGLNDGLCVPVFFIALALAQTEDGSLSGASAAHLVLDELGWGLAAGIAAGAVGVLALRTAARHRSVEPHWMQILTLATAALAAGTAEALGGSIFIAAFSAGFVFGALRKGSGGEVAYLVDQGGELLNGVTFVVFGAAILGPVLGDLGWQIVLYAVVSLTVVRMLPVALAMLGTGARRPTVAFLGWFGPRGLASIVFGVILVDQGSLPHQKTLLQAMVATVGISVFAHGLSARPLTARYAGWFASHPRQARPMESVPARDQRWRTPQPPSRPAG